MSDATFVYNPYPNNYFQFMSCVQLTFHSTYLFQYIRCLFVVMKRQSCRACKRYSLRCTGQPLVTQRPLLNLDWMLEASLDWFPCPNTKIMIYHCVIFLSSEINLNDPSCYYKWTVICYFCPKCFQWCWFVLYCRALDIFNISQFTTKKKHSYWKRFVHS